MIGDTTYDIEMAHAAGASSIGVSWGYHRSTPCAQPALITSRPTARPSSVPSI